MSYAIERGPGHADNACDYVAASVAEEFLRRDPASLMDVRVAGGHGALFVAAEAHTTADFDVSACVRRALASVDPGLTLEPFVALEAKRAPHRSEAVNVFGYATSETSSGLPASMDAARTLVRMIERLRRLDAEWFWLAPDYEVSVHEGQTLVRAAHAPSVSLEDARKKLTDALAPHTVGELLINVAGADTRAGLMGRTGSSGRAHQAFGAKLPSNVSGVGREISAPENLGRWLARAAARELVAAGLGKAVMVHLYYRPLESRPAFIVARNERGERLDGRLNRERFDLAVPAAGFADPRLLTAELRHVFDGAEVLPWET